jgi:hypothetical protein
LTDFLEFKLVRLEGGRSPLHSASPWLVEQMAMQGVAVVLSYQSAPSQKSMTAAKPDRAWRNNPDICMKSFSIV